jgi:malonyl CoA-acyl carrier protein transacylase
MKILKLLVNDEKKEKEIIDSYNEALKVKEDAENKLIFYFKNVVTPALNVAETKEDFVAIKERLKAMPYSVQKILLFRMVLVKQKEKLGIVENISYEKE